MSQKIAVSIIGPTGYTGLELIRLLSAHPNVTLNHLVSKNNAGQSLSALHPHLAGVCDNVLIDIPLSRVAGESDVVFLALPHGESQRLVPELFGKTKIIDLSADFRILKTDSATPHFLYGLPEKGPQTIAAAKNVANPGCFAAAAELALLPLKDNLKNVFISAVTGSSGSGKMPKEEAHHPVRNHNMKSYKIGAHPHLQEITQTLGLPPSQIVFVPTSGPFTRGIHMTVFVELSEPLDLNKISDSFKHFYQNDPFVRLKDYVELAAVIGSNFCDIALHPIGDKLVVQTVIDNLVKGAAGNAIQNMNLMFGLPQTTGLSLMSPLYP